jgi:LPS-assembly protein
MLMKNKLLILIITLFFFNDLVFAKEFIFKTKNLEIIDNGKIIYGGKGKVVTADGDLEINANKFEYDKELDILNTSGEGLLLINSKNLKINFDFLTIDQKKFLIKTNGVTKILDKKNNLIILSDSIIYDQKKLTIKSDTKSEIKDKFQNSYKVDNFFYEINKNLLKVNNLDFKDNANNTLKTSLAYINTKTNRIFGKDVNVELNNETFNKDNEPRLKGNSIINDANTATITKGIFTTCKRRDKCPPWQLSAETIQHDKKNKVINYKNALLSVYDFPVMYFPKFFHPDPTVKRQSGFLIPSVNNQNNSSNYLNTPYFLAISKNKDATFSPRFYSDDKILLQTEYRQANRESNHIADFSFFGEKNKSSKNHFFYKFDKILDFSSFENSKFDLKIQKTSNDTYLKKNKIMSEITTDEDILENTLKLNLYSNDISMNLESTVYENLNKNSSDRYEFILPKIDLVKKIENRTNLKGDFSFKSQNLIRNYETNIFEKSNINDLIFASYPKIFGVGFYNDYKFIVKNANTDSQKSSNHKDDENLYLSTLFQYNSTLPLINENNEYQNILKPKVSLKLAPSHTKDHKNKNTKIDASNLFSLNREIDNDTVEGGISLAYGSDYSIYDKINTREILSFKLANNFRFRENKDLPSNNQLGQKTSNFFTETKFNPYEFINVRYNSSIKNNLSDIAYENLITEFKVNNFVTTFDYVNENNTEDKNSYLTSTAKYVLDDSNNLSFSTRDNKTVDLTEYYNLVYQYKNDCLAASVEYNKEYYDDRDIDPSESIFFKLTIIPFGEASSPNLKN